MAASARSLVVAADILLMTLGVGVMMGWMSRARAVTDTLPPRNSGLFKNSH